MARTPQRPRQPSLPFPPDPDEAPAPQGSEDSDEEGNRHAVHDDRPRSSSGAPGDVRPAPQPAAAGADAGALRGRAEAAARRLDGTPPLDPAGERQEPGVERSPGAGAGEPARPIAQRILNGRHGSALPKRRRRKQASTVSITEDRPDTHATPGEVPGLIRAAGPAACAAWDDFLYSGAMSVTTRYGYRTVVLRFLGWLEPQGIAVAD